MAVSREPEFGTVRMREGYDLDDVDDFVDVVIDSLDGKGSRKVTPEQIERYEFKIVRMRTGYSMEDVDRWLDEAAAEMRARLKAARQAEPARAAQPPPPPPPVAPPPPPAAPPVSPYDDSTQWWPAPTPPAPPAPPPLPTPAPMPVPAAGYTTTTTYGTPAYDPQPSYPPSTPLEQTGHGRDTGTARAAALVHHIELWVRDFDSGVASWGWLFQRLGWRIGRVWEHGCAWASPDGPYIVIESGPDLRWMPHDRRSPGMNHLAFEVPDRATVDRIVADGPLHGWQLMFPDRHPFAGGPDHYAAYMENGEGFEVEIVSAE